MAAGSRFRIRKRVYPEGWGWSLGFWETGDVCTGSDSISVRPICDLEKGREFKKSAKPLKSLERVKGIEPS